MPNKCRNVLKILSHVILYFLILVPVVGFIAFLAPYQRGFFCNDDSIRLPYREDSVSVSLLLGVGFLFPIALMVVIELVHRFTTDKRVTSEVLLHDERPTLPCYVRCYIFIGLFLFGGMMQFLTVFIAKFAVGRLRPNFIDVCKPDWSRVECVDDAGFPRYVSEDVCTTGDERQLSDARQSFPSGHAAWGAFAAIYMMMYFQVRWTWNGSRLLRSSAQIIFLWAGFYCGISRIPDNKHHIGDVLSGFIIGTGIAVFIFSNTGFIRLPTQSSLFRQLAAVYKDMSSKLKNEETLPIFNIAQTGKFAETPVQT